MWGDVETPSGTSVEVQRRLYLKRKIVIIILRLLYTLRDQAIGSISLWAMYIHGNHKPHILFSVHIFYIFFFSLSLSNLKLNWELMKWQHCEWQNVLFAQVSLRVLWAPRGEGKCCTWAHSCCMMLCTVNTQLELVIIHLLVTV